MGMMSLVSEYGKLMRSVGIKNPIFYIQQDAAQIIAHTFLDNALTVTVASQLDETKKNIPGVIGEFDGVLLVEYETSKRF